eukprot:7080945-Alexandrium_andersonii.AAC.1
MWSCPRFGREQDRPADALAARNGWPSREAGAVWTVKELCEAKERVLQMARIYRNVKDLRYPETKAQARARRAAQGPAAR